MAESKQQPTREREGTYLLLRCRVCDLTVDVEPPTSSPSPYAVLLRCPDCLGWDLGWFELSPGLPVKG